MVEYTVPFTCVRFIFFFWISYVLQSPNYIRLLVFWHSTMGGKGKSSKGKKSDGPAIPFFCKVCKEYLDLGFSLASEHVKECQRKADLRVKEDLRMKQEEAAKAQELADARRGRDN